MRCDIAICTSVFLIGCTAIQDRPTALTCIGEQPTPVASLARFSLSMDEVNQRLSLNSGPPIAASITSSKVMFPMSEERGTVIIDRVAERFTMNVNDRLAPSLLQVTGKCEPGSR